MKKNSFLAAAGLGTAMLFSASAFALTADETKFVNSAAIAGMFEIEASKIALDRTQNADLRSFAKQMVADHTKASNDLTMVATAKSVTLPTTLDDKHMTELNKLKDAKAGKAFDEAYADVMEDSHDDAVALFEMASKNAKDPELKAFATKTLPTLKMHSEHAEKLDMSKIAP